MLFHQVEYIQYIKSIPIEEARQAEMALYRRQPDEAERILLQANPPLIYRAIKLNITLFRWNRALELATKHRQHVETVVYYRKKDLNEFDKEENIKKFAELHSTVSPSHPSIIYLIIHLFEITNTAL